MCSLKREGLLVVRDYPPSERLQGAALQVAACRGAKGGHA